MKLAIVVGSTRPNRQTLKEAKWVQKSAEAIEGVEVVLVDLKDYPMPFFDEPVSPRYNPNREINPDVKKWLDALSGCDAFVFVTPEYNHSITGVLKNALDFLTSELYHKPTAIVSHGSVGGSRAAVQLREILSESRTVVIPNAVAFIGVSEAVDEEGNINEEVKANPYGPQGQLDSTLTELKWYSDALSAASNQQ